MAILATHFDLFLVSFHGVTDQYIFDGKTSEQLGDLIQQHGQNGIEFIKRFDKSKSSFKTISKATVKQLFSYDTHSFLELQKINFIK